MTPYYQDDAVTIYHGDTLEVMAEWGGASVSCIVTSPPYNTLGSRVPARPTGMHKGSGWLSKVHAVGYADDMSESDYAAWLADLGAALADVSIPGASLFFNHKPRLRDKAVIHPIDYVRSFRGWTLRQEIVWDRPGAVAFNARMFAPSDERIYWMVRDGADHKWNQVAASFLTVWRMRPVVGSRHPAPYPIDLPAKCIAATTDPGDIVLDPFMGSGTTMMAAKAAGLRSVGIEADERWCEMAANRCRQEVLGLV